MEVAGYEVTVAGLDMVAHRTITTVGVGDPEPSTTYWTVTDPRTGMSICDGWVEKTKTIKLAVKCAEEIVSVHGGAAGVNAKVAERLERAEFRPPALAENT
jgi:hypothetical protein